ncbi:hypothetical protein AN219_37840 [Streptomyces nanshensis]|nr:hypothetical protein AN219_37840 [Streptomyces nanshensis]
MPERSTTNAVLGLAALSLLTITSCSHSSPNAPEGTAASAKSHSPARSAREAQPTARVVSTGQLIERLLNAEDLGQGYTLKPGRPADHDDMTVIGCPALQKLGGDGAASGTLDFPHHAKATFTYAGGADSEVTEELYSDTETNLSEGTRRIFDAMASCPAYQVTDGSTPIKVTTDKTPVAKKGEEQWGQLLTLTVAGRSSIIKQAAVRQGSILVVVSGSPGLVDAHLNKALHKVVARG